MEVIIPGTLAHVEMKAPTGDQKFKAHNLLSITQIQNGKVEVVHIKDEVLDRKYPELGSVHAKVVLFHWTNNGQSGNSFKLVGFLENKK